MTDKTLAKAVLNAGKELGLPPPNPSNVHESILYAKPPCEQMWFYQTQVHNPLDVALRIVWFDAFGEWEGQWYPGNVKERPLNGLDFSQWYGDGDRPLKQGVIGPGQTARCDVNWHCGWDGQHPNRHKWAYRAVTEDGSAFYGEAIIESAPHPDAGR